MQEMVREYQETRKRLRERIHVLDEVMQREKLGNRELSALESRRDLLVRECTEMLHSVQAMQQHGRNGGIRR